MPIIREILRDRHQEYLQAQIDEGYWQGLRGGMVLGVICGAGLMGLVILAFEVAF